MKVEIDYGAFYRLGPTQFSRLSNQTTLFKETNCTFIVHQTLLQITSFPKGLVWFREKH